MLALSASLSCSLRGHSGERDGGAGRRRGGRSLVAPGRSAGDVCTHTHTYSNARQFILVHCMSQQFLFRSLPTRLLSRWWGGLMECQLLPWLRRPLLGTYVWVFGCNMAEAKVEDLREYSSFSALFTRELKEGVRPVSADCELVSALPVTSRISG